MPSFLTDFKMGRAHRLARANYIPRMVGFIASFIAIGLLVVERGWSSWYFFFLTISLLIYPNFILLLSKLRPGDKRVELWAMKFESVMLGFWIVAIEFYLWQSYAFLAGALVTNTMIGGFRQMFQTLALFLGGMLMGGLIMGAEVQLDGPFYIDIIVMIMLILFIINAAASFYSQARKLAGMRSKMEDKNEKLNETVEELKSTRNELVEKAHKAGMADLATGVLHNIGNILNSVNISTSVINETLQKSKIPKLQQANELLDEHKDNLKEFIAEDSRGPKLLNYYLKLGQPLSQEHEKLQEHCNRLIDKVNLMLEVIDAQQDYAKVGRIVEEVQLEEIVEDTLKLQAGSIERHELHIQKDFEDTDTVEVQKSKLIHILVNLFKNAKEAMTNVNRDERVLTIGTSQDEDHIYLSISDNGDGISEANKKKIFNHGFTTKRSGHGYGLHTCANYMAEMDGKILVESEGQGATFTLLFPKK
ncbi:ATP-binding protein [Fodinibius halophilus]|uniref:histidine kinase n=1 Tax=Fodinibius halophilus TaxID=1736908 RepID=A0A6M1T404_9BACT|nr:ATP-binding protein [Fodinibius halophilus]NGP87955.1 GHKL domain-containing protein [Fodinibius halophilus]